MSTSPGIGLKEIQLLVPGETETENETKLETARQRENGIEAGKRVAEGGRQKETLVSLRH